MPLRLRNDLGAAIPLALLLEADHVKRTGIKRKSATKRRTTSPRCDKQRCNNRAEIEGLCISHAETEADDVFSLFVRRRDRGVCTAMAVLSGECAGNLQAAHIVGRRNHTVRYDPTNVHALCQTHHMTVDQHGQEHAKYLWASSRVDYDDLMARARPITDRRASIEAAFATYGRLAESKVPA